MNEITDVAVVGTGPAGSSAALLLAQRGASVVLIDKAALPRYKTCGGGLLPRAVRLLPPDVSAIVERACTDVEINFIDSGLHFLARRPQALIAMTMRADLDHLLAVAATRAGAVLRVSCPVTGLIQDRDGVTLRTPSGDLRARFVIAADGANSSVATAAGWKETRTLIPALEYEVRTGAEDLARLGQSARFDFGGIDAGYAWVFPKRSHLSVGVLSMRRGKVQLQQAVTDYMKLLGIAAPLSVQKHGYVIPVTPRRDGMVRGRVLLVGDAAGLVDPVTAEGISHAVVSGQLAAESLLDASLHASESGTIYQQRLDRFLLPELRIARVLARLLYHTPRLRHWLFRRHGQALSEFVAEIVSGNATYRGALRNPINWIKLLR